MIISMQGNWTVTVKSKSAAYPQRFVVQGAIFGNGVHSGTPGTSVNVIGIQWSIAIQHDPGTGWQGSYTKLQFPHQSGGNYEFDILSDDSREDADFNDIILTCSTPVNINDFIIYGNVTLYSGRCIFNPCRQYPFYVIDTYPGLLAALRNEKLRALIEELYPERIPPFRVGPNPPDPPPFFKPIVLDMAGEAMQPKTTLKYLRKQVDEKKRNSKSDKEMTSEFASSDFELVSSDRAKSALQGLTISQDKIRLLKDLGKLFMPCLTEPGSNLTITFEEYDRTAAELAGGAYTGEGNRRLLGDTITDMNGNYIFKFRFDMTFPGLEDSSDIASGEDVNTVMYPDVIVKIVEYSPFRVRYESAPFFNIPNLKRINLCLPESSVSTSSSCFNGNLIGSLGNVFIGGIQNTSASILGPDLIRDGYSNYLDSDGKITVNSPLAFAGNKVECAAWFGTVDMKGCMYDTSVSKDANKIIWYTIRIRRSGTSRWEYVSQNYKHPKFSKRNLANYIGDDVGPFYTNPDTNVLVGGTLNGDVPFYINIQREINVNNVDWEFSNSDRYMQLNTALYDVVAGIRTPGTFYVRVDGYDGTGNHVPGGTDLIALFIHNNGLSFSLTKPFLNAVGLLQADCGLYRLTNDQLSTPIKVSFKAGDEFGFVDFYKLTIDRCQGLIDIHRNMPDPDDIASGTSTILEGSGLLPWPVIPPNTPNTFAQNCPGYTGTFEDFTNSDLTEVELVPSPANSGWIKAGEYYTLIGFHLTAWMRVTNGYNTGVYGPYYAYNYLAMERLNP